MANEFIRKDDNIIVNVDHMEAYIPEDLFKNEESNSAIATMYGEAFKVMGLFNMRVSNTPDEDLSKTPLRTFNYPNMILTYPSSSYTKEMSLTNNDEPIRYRVLCYTRGDIMMSATMPKNADNSVKFLNMLTRGKIPSTLTYNQVWDAWLANLESNSVNPGIPYLYMQCIIAELYRSAKNPTIPFRKVYGKDMNSNAYSVSNMRGTAAYSSVFTAQVFEDMGRMLTTSINMCRRGITQDPSPIEKVLWL